MTSWTAQINKHIVILPAGITSDMNGQIPASLLSDVFNGHGTRIGRLNKPAARSWQAMVAAALADKILLDATDTYRIYSEQVRIFKERYQTTPIKFSASRGYVTRKWQGLTWYQKPHTAAAAVPGTSNHGKAGAVDDKNTSGPSLTWLENNANRFGWEWELASEAWHLHYWPGDAIPKAVLDYEAGSHRPEPIPTPIIPKEEEMLHIIQCDPTRDEWPEVKPHVFKTDLINVVHSPTPGHGDRCAVLDPQNTRTYESPNFIYELLASNPAGWPSWLPRPTKATHPSLSSAE